MRNNYILHNLNKAFVVKGPKGQTILEKDIKDGDFHTISYKERVRGLFVRDLTKVLVSQRINYDTFSEPC